MKKIKRGSTFALEQLETRVLLTSNVAAPLPEETALGIAAPVVPTPESSLIDAGTVSAIRGLSNLVGPYAGEAKDVGAHEKGLGTAWTGPRQFTKQLAYGLPDDWAVSPLTQLADFIDLGAPNESNEARLLISRAEPRSFILVEFESVVGAGRWDRYNEFLQAIPETAGSTQAIFRDGLAATLQSSGEIATLTGQRVDHNGILTIRGAVAENDRPLVEDEMFSFVRSLYYAWDEHSEEIPLVPHGVIAVGSPPSPSNDAAVTTGVLHGDVTLSSASILWDVEGDSNQNAVATIKFRRLGSLEWQEALDLNRVIYEGSTKHTHRTQNLNRFAGSIFALSPETTYELEATIEDVDGGSFSQSTQFTTRSVPRTPWSASVSEVHTPEQLADSTSVVVLLHAGDYGTFNILRGGTPQKPVIYKAFGDGPVRFDRINIFTDHVWIDGVDVEQGGIHGISDPPNHIQEGITVTRSTVTNSDHSIDAWGTDWLVTDNILSGRGAFGEGIEFRGRGHVAAFNDISNVFDGISYGDGNIDVHNNAIHDIHDDAIEPDYAWDNYRIWENQTWRSGFHGISFQPTQGGPWYIFRNQITGASYNPLKMRGGVGAKFLVSNTIIYQRHIQNVDKLFQKDGVFANNFLYVDAPNDDDFIGDGTLPSPIEMRLWDYNQYDVQPDKVFKLNGPKTLQELRRLGIESNSIVTRNFTKELIANPDRYSLYTGGVTGVLYRNLISNDRGPVRTTMRVTEIDSEPLPDSPITGKYGTLNLTTSGDFSYELDDQHPEVIALDAGEQLVETFDYKLYDGVSESSSNLTIYIQGGVPPSNGTGRPKAHHDFVDLQSDEPFVEFNVLRNDSDPQNDPLFIKELIFTEGQYGRVEFETDGNITYFLDLEHPQVQQMPPGAKLVDAFMYVASDGSGIDIENIVITITGTTRADELTTTDDVYSLQEDEIANIVSGNVLSNDSSGSGPLTVVSLEGSSQNIDLEIPGVYGTLSLSETGQLIYELDNENRSVDALDEDEFLTEEFTYEVSDGTQVQSAIIRFQIYGVDDGHYPEVFADLVQASADGRTYTGNVLSNDFDRDGEQLGISRVGDSASQVGQVLEVNYGTLQIDMDGSYWYRVNLDHPDVNRLDADTTLTESISYTASDNVRSSFSFLTIEITGPSNRLVGDANGDGIFNSSDLVTVFQAGEYEDEIANNSNFTEGDWNGDGDFNSSDLVLAFQSGNYRMAAAQLAAIDQSLSMAPDFLSDDDEPWKRQR